MISIILDFLMAVFLARIVIWVAQLFLTSGQSDGGDAGGARGGSAGAPGGMGDATWGSPSPGGRPSRRGQPSIDRSSAIDVPFTEIPPDTDAHDDIPARSAAGDR